MVQLCGHGTSVLTASSLSGLFWTGFQRRLLLQTTEYCCRLSSAGEVILQATALPTAGTADAHPTHPKPTLYNENVHTTTSHAFVEPVVEPDPVW